MIRSRIDASSLRSEGTRLKIRPPPLLMMTMRQSIPPSSWETIHGALLS
jgi:hypothetical protein